MSLLRVFVSLVPRPSHIFSVGTRLTKIILLCVCRCLVHVCCPYCEIDLQAWWTLDWQTASPTYHSTMVYSHQRSKLLVIWHMCTYVCTLYILVYTIDLHMNSLLVLLVDHHGITHWLYVGTHWPCPLLWEQETSKISYLWLTQWWSQRRGLQSTILTENVWKPCIYMYDIVCN